MSFCIHQPAFLPWGGYWAKVLSTDHLVVMVGVDHSKGDMSSRVKLKGSYLSLPLLSGVGGPFKSLRYDVRSAPKIMKTLKQTYTASKFPHSSRLDGVYEAFHYLNTGSLIQITDALFWAVLGSFNHHLTRVETSHYRPEGETTEDRLLDFMHHHELTGTYHSGAGGRSYLTGKFASRGIQTLFQQGEYDDETVLTVLAREPDPTDYLLSRTQWLCN